MMNVNIIDSNKFFMPLLLPILALPPVAHLLWLEPLAKWLGLDLALSISIFDFFFVRIGDLDTHCGIIWTLIILRRVLGNLQQVLRQPLIVGSQWGWICSIVIILFIRCLYLARYQLLGWWIWFSVFSDGIFGILLCTLIIHILSKLRYHASFSRYYPLLSVNSDDCMVSMIFLSIIHIYFLLIVAFCI